MHAVVEDLLYQILSCYLEYTNPDLSMFSLNLSFPFITMLSFFFFYHQHHYSTLRTSVQHQSHQNLATSGVFSSLPLHIWEAGEG